MECISSTSWYLLELNINSTDEFSLRHGLRQWDHLSPFMFLLAVEGLNSLFSASMSVGHFEGFLVGGNNFRVIHHVGVQNYVLWMKYHLEVYQIRVTFISFVTILLLYMFDKESYFISWCQKYWN